MNIKSEKALLSLLASQPQTKNDLAKLKRQLAESSGQPISGNSQLLATYNRLLAAKKIQPEIETTKFRVTRKCQSGRFRV